MCYQSHADKHLWIIVLFSNGARRINVKITTLMSPLRRLITTPVIFIKPLLITSSRAWLMAARRRPSRLFIAVSSPRLGLWPWQITSSVSAGWRLRRRWCHPLIFVYPWKYLSILRESSAAVSGSRGLHFTLIDNLIGKAERQCHLIVFSISAVTPRMLAEAFHPQEIILN